MNWIKSISDQITKVFSAIRTPMPYISGLILACGAVNRPGLSAQIVASNIIRRQGEAGIPGGPAADGSANLSEAMEVIRVEEIFKAIKNDAGVQIGIPIGGIKITGTAANGLVSGFNTNSAHGVGVVI